MAFGFGYLWISLDLSGCEEIRPRHTLPGSLHEDC